MRRNFAQVLKEAGIDLKKEYSRLYESFYLHEPYVVGSRYVSLWGYCASQFGSYPFRGTCISLNDFDDTYGFSFDEHPSCFDIDYLVSFCEYSYNLSYYSKPSNYYHSNLDSYVDEQPSHYVQLVEAIVDKIGYMIVNDEESDNSFIILPKLPGAIAVSEICSQKNSFSVIEYNHFSLKGDLEKKVSILKRLADEIEPRRPELKQIPGSPESELFQMLNKFVRHNNESNPVIASMKPEEIENVYDDIYQMWLLSMLELDNVERKARTKELLGKINK